MSKSKLEYGGVDDEDDKIDDKTVVVQPPAVPIEPVKEKKPRSAKQQAVNEQMRERLKQKRETVQKIKEEAKAVAELQKEELKKNVKKRIAEEDLDNLVMEKLKKFIELDDTERVERIVKAQIRTKSKEIAFTSKTSTTANAPATTTTQVYFCLNINQYNTIV